MSAVDPPKTLADRKDGKHKGLLLNDKGIAGDILDNHTVTDSKVLLTNKWPFIRS
jgi:hypothetical protein